MVERTFSHPKIPKKKKLPFSYDRYNNECISAEFSYPHLVVKLGRKHVELVGEVVALVPKSLKGWG